MSEGAGVPSEAGAPSSDEGAAVLAGGAAPAGGPGGKEAQAVAVTGGVHAGGAVVAAGSPSLPS